MMSRSPGSRGAPSRSFSAPQLGQTARMSAGSDSSPQASANPQSWHVTRRCRAPERGSHRAPLNHGRVDDSLHEPGPRHQRQASDGHADLDEAAHKASDGRKTTEAQRRRQDYAAERRQRTRTGTTSRGKPKTQLNVSGLPHKKWALVRDKVGWFVWSGCTALFACFRGRPNRQASGHRRVSSSAMDWKPCRGSMARRVSTSQTNVAACYVTRPLVTIMNTSSSVGSLSAKDRILIPARTS